MSEKGLVLASLLHGEGSLEGFSIGAEGTLQGHSSCLVPLNLQTDVWVPVAATKDDGDEMGGGGMAAALITRADPELLLSPVMGPACFQLTVSPCRCAGSTPSLPGAEPPVTARGSC